MEVQELGKWQVTCRDELQNNQTSNETKEFEVDSNPSSLSSSADETSGKITRKKKEKKIKKGKEKTKQMTYHVAEKRDCAQRDYGGYEENVIEACRYRGGPDSQAAGGIPGTDRSGRN